MQIASNRPTKYQVSLADSQRGGVRFNPWQVNEGFLSGKVEFGQDLFQVRWIYPVSNIAMMVEHNLFAHNLA